MIKIIIWGAGGRMGRQALQVITREPDLALTGAVEMDGHQAIGQDIGEYHGLGRMNIITTTDLDISGKTGVVLDFSLTGGPGQASDWCALNGWNLVTGTTALSKNDHQSLQAAAQKIAIMAAPNFSLGIQLVLASAAKASSLLPDDFEVTIHETHHSRKKDKPSGTAKAIKQAVNNHSKHTRKIDISSLRINDIIGEHELRFISPYEDITITHRALSRRLFIMGAIKCIRWITDRPPGLYSMKDALE